MFAESYGLTREFFSPSVTHFECYLQACHLSCAASATPSGPPPAAPACGSRDNNVQSGLHGPYVLHRLRWALWAGGFLRVPPSPSFPQSPSARVQQKLPSSVPAVLLPRRTRSVPLGKAGEHVGKGFDSVTCSPRPVRVQGKRQL